jgi:hypothetical protein
MEPHQTHHPVAWPDPADFLFVLYHLLCEFIFSMCFLNLWCEMTRREKVLRYCKVARYDANYCKFGFLKNMGGIGAHSDSDYTILRRFVEYPWEWQETMQVECHQWFMEPHQTHHPVAWPDFFFFYHLLCYFWFSMCFLKLWSDMIRKEKVLRYCKVARYDANYGRFQFLKNMGGIGAHSDSDCPIPRRFVEYPGSGRRRCKLSVTSGLWSLTRHTTQ